MLSTDTLFHAAAHAARNLMVKYEQQSIALNNQIDEIWEELIAIPKSQRKGHPVQLKYIELNNQLAEADRKANEYRQAYKEAVTLY